MSSTLTATRPRKTGGRPPASYDLDALARCARQQFDRTGRWPTVNGGTQAGDTGRTWDAVDSYLAARGSSLSRFLDDRFPERLAGPPTPDEVAALALAFFQEHGAWPTGRTTGTVGPGGRTWSQLDKQLRAARSSLPRLLDARFPAERARTLRARLTRGSRGGQRLEPEPTVAELAERIAHKPLPGREALSPLLGKAAPLITRAAEGADDDEDGPGDPAVPPLAALLVEFALVRERHAQEAAAGQWTLAALQAGKGVQRG